MKSSYAYSCQKTKIAYMPYAIIYRMNYQAQIFCDENALRDISNSRDHWTTITTSVLKLNYTIMIFLAKFETQKNHKNFDFLTNFRTLTLELHKYGYGEKFLLFLLTEETNKITLSC